MTETKKGIQWGAKFKMAGIVEMTCLVIMALILFIYYIVFIIMLYLMKDPAVDAIGAKSLAWYVFMGVEWKYTLLIVGLPFLSLIIAPIIAFISK